MKTENILIIGAIAAGIYWLTNKDVAAATDVSSSNNPEYPIQSVYPTQATAPLPTTVTFAQPTTALKQNTRSALRAVSSPIQITEGGRSYIPPYQIVEVGVGGKKISGISFGGNKYTALSSGFAKKLKATGLA